MQPADAESAAALVPRAPLGPGSPPAVPSARAKPQVRTGGAGGARTHDPGSMSAHALCAVPTSIDARQPGTPDAEYAGQVRRCAGPRSVTAACSARPRSAAAATSDSERPSPHVEPHISDFADPCAPERSPGTALSHPRNRDIRPERSVPGCRGRCVTARRARFCGRLGASTPACRE
jgi:hypothetical protein